MHSITKSKLEETLVSQENLQLALRRIFKDLIGQYDRVKKGMKGVDNKKYNDGLSILNLAPEDLEDYLSPCKIY